MAFDQRVTSFSGLGRGMGPLGGYGLAPSFQPTKQIQVGPGQVTDPTQQLAQAMNPQGGPAPLGKPPVNPQYGDLAKAMIAQGTSTGPVGGNLEALARPLEALAGVYLQRKQGDFDTKAMDYKDQQLAQALGGISDPAKRQQIMMAFKANPALGATMFEQATKPPAEPKMRTRELGDQNVTEQFNPATGAFDTLGYAPRWEPKKVEAPTSRNREVGDQTVNESFNPATGAWDTNSYAPRWQAKDDTPPGYQRGPDGKLIPMAGGPQDPATIATQAAARDPFFFQDTTLPDGTQQRVAIPRGDVPTGGGVVGSKPAQATQEQSLAGGFANRIAAANSVLEKLDTQGADWFGAMAGGLPGGNYLQTPEYQRYDRAVRDFVNAQLRRESGAAISPSEFDNARKQYFPQPGDSPEVIADKRTARQLAFDNMARSAGPTFKAPAGQAKRPDAVPQELWDVMTPEERAAFR